MSKKIKSNRLKKLLSIPKPARVDHRHTLNSNGELPFLSDLTRKERRELKRGTKKISRRYKQIFLELCKSGAGFPIDKFLRQQAIEYNHRFASSGTNNLPTSFNYFEPFLSVDLIKGSYAPFTKPTKEVDHIFNLSDFFDFVTAKESKGFKLEDMMSLDEKKIFHFTTNGDLSDLSFLNADRGEFVISGFSMIRHERSLYWYLIGGEVLGKDAWQLKCSEQPEIELKHIDPVKRAFLKESLEKNKSIGAPIGLEGTNFTQKNIIAGEIDIITQKHLSRCYMNEYENTISTLCDDPETLYRLNEVNRESLLQSMIKELNNSSIIWNLAEGLLQLPQYFSYKVPLTNKNESKSDFMRPYRTFIKGGAGIDSKYITIPAIDINSTKKPAIRELFLPHYMTETNGHWRKLKEGQIGHDPDGKKTSGRTWVKQPISWKAVETKAQAIYVKDCLSTARIRINEYETALKKASQKVITTNEEDENLGEVYVMRCPAMNEQVFKVGYTSGKSIDRAKELSRATGIPLTFIVVKSWKHTKPAALEKEIHIMLAPYCINGRREFFYASFEKINKIIEGVLQRIKN